MQYKAFLKNYDPGLKLLAMTAAAQRMALIIGLLNTCSGFTRLVKITSGVAS
jgi:hypothetical protein